MVSQPKILTNRQNAHTHRAKQARSVSAGAPIDLENIPAHTAILTHQRQISKIPIPSGIINQ